MPYSYLLINIAVFSIPFWRSFDPRVKIYQHFKAIWKAIFLTALLFILWDIYFTYLGVWGFNPKFNFGLNLFNLPISEVLFFLTVPYACIFSYLVLEHFFKDRKILNFNPTLINYLLAGIFLMLLIIFVDRNYTMLASLLALLILIYNIVEKKTYMARFYFSYFILTIPFLLVNGILTGSYSDEPIVWYNNSENLNLRIMEIPVDDLIYNFALLLINITLFEKFRKTKA